MPRPRTEYRQSKWDTPPRKPVPAFIEKEREDWLNKARPVWEARCRAVADQICETCNIGLDSDVPYGNWASEAGGKTLEMTRTAYFEPEDPQADSDVGHVSMVFFMSNAAGKGATLPVDAYAAVHGDMIALDGETRSFSADEAALWKVYSGLVRFHDETLSDLGLAYLFEQAQVALEQPVGSNLQDFFDYADQMLSAVKMPHLGLDEAAKEVARVHEAYIEKAETPPAP